MRQNCFRVCLMFEIALQIDKARLDKTSFFLCQNQSEKLKNTRGGIICYTKAEEGLYGK